MVGDGCLTSSILFKAERSRGHVLVLSLARARRATRRVPSKVFIGIWDGDNVSQLPYVWYYVGVKSSFQHVRVECESKRAYVFLVPDV